MYREFPWILLYSTHPVHQFPLLLTLCISVTYLLQLISQYVYFIINESPWFTLRFIPVLHIL